MSAADERWLRTARQVMDTEAAAISSAGRGLGEGFSQAVAALLAAQGKAVLTGTGKSGHVARKIAATLASTGTPAFFLHPADAGHGDLGMIGLGDAVVALSRSGAAGDLDYVIAHARRLNAPVIAMTCAPDSPLAQAADFVIAVDAGAEACPLGLAPTSSTAAMMAVGDALAMTVLEARGFTAEDFGRTHPHGALGKRLLRVADVMLSGERLPLVAPATSVAEAVVVISAKRLGVALVAEPADRLLGVFTDGDLRRCLERGADIQATAIGEEMTSDPRTIDPSRLVEEALACMEESKITQLPAVADGRLEGLVDIHALMQRKVV